MRTTFTKGDIIAGFEILDIVELHELAAQGIYAKHLQSGTELFHIFNDDEENLFAYTFATAPDDSSGIAHILEHSVLCGSKNYPLKDPFAVLAQGSLQTYLNAWTFPDKTVYPASSVNETDYFNLMSVYGDAVFRPLLDEWTFMQEGHRLEFKKDEAAGDTKAALGITGVVYNEMKGAYSALDEYAQHWSFKSVLPDTPYNFDSGGDPACIPNLSFEEFRAFHKKKYAPANCKIFLAGNIPTEKQLHLLNDKFFHDLSSVEAGAPACDVPLAKKWHEPRTFVVSAPAGGDTKSTVFISWICGGDVKENPAELIQLTALTEVLLGHDGSPLMRTLVESPLGEDLASVCGLEFELRQPVWTVGLRGVAKETNEKEIEALIMNELQKLATEGIPKKEIESALLSLEFSHREIKRAGGPWSIALLRRCLRGWLHHCKPWETVLFAPALEKLKVDIKNNPRFFEDLITALFLDNPHRALVVIQPEDDFIEKQEAALKEKIVGKEKSFSKNDIKNIQQNARELEKKQSEPDSPEALRSIPHIWVKNLSPEIDIIPRTMHDADGVPVLSHKLWTNGISYYDFAFPYDVLSPQDYIYMPLFFHCITALGVPGMDYAELSSLLSLSIGDFYAMPHSGSAVAGAPHEIATPCGSLDLAGRDWLSFKLKTLDEKIAPSIELVLRTVKEADFSDLRRLRDLVLELKNQVDSSLAPNGNMFASARAAQFASTALAKAEVCSGLTQISAYHTIAELGTAEIARTLSRIRDELFSKTGMIVSITGEAEKENLAALAKYCAPFGAPRPRNPASEDISHFINMSGLDTINDSPPQKNKKNCELFSSPSLQIGFAAMCIRSSGYKDELSMAEQLLAHYLSTGPLWETIRMKGGAYGAHTAADSIENNFAFSTYRDPDPSRSLETFSSILKKAASTKIDEDTLEKTIIGVYSKIKQPRTSLQKGWIDFIRFLSGIEDEERAKHLSQLLNAQAQDLCTAAATLHERIADGKSAIITSRSDAEKTAKRLKLQTRDVGV
ncbi:MAG: insulinase family protein [Spirochaetaceae bacterium]|jgi:Zn-dependent M16 (insulinase) family peptidase|nr:insulinase family protein [Spirochaetaceae bacterium]